jgi:hypothetical protein
VTDAWAPPDAPGETRSRAGCVVALVVLFLAGFAGVATVALLRAPDGRPGTGTALETAIVPPPGYVPLDDATSGGGPLTAARAASVLGLPRIEGYRDGVLHAWGREPGAPVRGVVVLVVEVASPAGATALRDAYVARATARGATPFDAPDPLRGVRDGPDSGGRYAQRVAFATGSRLWLVSVVTPDRETDPAEVVLIAQRQRR